MSTLDTDSTWHQANLWCDDWKAAEHIAATHLAPLLTAADNPAAGWWFVRKGESWRLRFRTIDRQSDTVTEFIKQLGALEGVRRCVEVTYEPEVHAFGGSAAMTVAHVLFHADSRHILTHLARKSDGADHRRELALLLSTRLMRAAGQDWYEQGDIWAHVATHRLHGAASPPPPATLIAVQQLLTAIGDTPGGPLAEASTWSACFEHAGRTLADLHHRGDLTRGIRAVLAHHVLFTMNRLGVSAADQYALATAATHVVFHQDQHAAISQQTNQPERTTVTTVTTDTIQTPEADPNQLRQALVERIGSLDAFKTSQVREAFLTVPREKFLPGVDLKTAYAPKPVVTKRAADDTAVSSASSPYIVASMLEQLDIELGNAVLEIGAATGINAALMAELAGPNGRVVTIEFDDDLATGARGHLATAGYGTVAVICGDGAFGHAAAAPYDRIIVTAGAWDISAAWWDQLAVGGRIVVPLRLHGSGLTRSIAFDLNQPDHMTSTSAVVCGFVPMRGAAEMGERHARLADDVILKIDATDQADENALARALNHPARTQWTGIQVRHDESAEHLDLWLATTQNDLAFGKISVGKAARDRDIANPALRWSGAALYRDGTVTYLTAQPVNDDADELGITTHGPDAETVTAEVRGFLQRWNEKRPAQPVITAHRNQQSVDKLPLGAQIIRPDCLLTITW